MDAKVLQGLPAPFNQEKFYEYRRGIYDNPEILVYMNEAEDFAFLFPQPSFDYVDYSPRVERLNLTAYRKRNQAVEKRFEKIWPYFAGSLDVLEIGSFDGAFLRLARERNDALRLASLEVDTKKQADRDQLGWLNQYASFQELFDDQQVRFDLACFFHVLEHVVNPADFLMSCSRLLKPEGKIIVEVPSLDDPLRRLYRVEEYEAFYFQTQHPYNYSAGSLCRLLATHGFRIRECLAHQRYGLENHLTWLAKRRPGGDEALREMFAPIDDQYRARLEAGGLADAVIVIAERVEWRG